MPLNESLDIKLSCGGNACRKIQALKCEIKLYIFSFRREMYGGSCLKASSASVQRASFFFLLLLPSTRDSEQTCNAGIMFDRINHNEHCMLNTSSFELS